MKGMDAKKFFRWFGLTVFGYALIMALFLLANATVFTLITSNPDRMKEIITDSGAYDNLPEAIFSSTENSANQQGQNNQTNNEISIDDPDVKKAILESFNPAFLQKSFENGVDGTYAWLSGETSQPNFSIDLTQPKEQLVSKMVDYRLKTIATLPPCDIKQLNSDLDVFNLNCKPPYALDPAQIKQQVKDEMAKNDEFLGKDKFVAADIKGQEGKAFYETFSTLPSQFQAAKKLPFVLVFFIGLFSAAIIYISETKKRGLLSLSRIFIVSGVLTLFAPTGINFISEKLLAATGNNQVVKDVVSPLIIEFNSATAYVYHWVGAVSIILGIVGLLAYSGKLKLPAKLKK